jgi:hypothetical protein
MFKQGVGTVTNEAKKPNAFQAKLNAIVDARENDKDEVEKRRQAHIAKQQAAYAAFGELCKTVIEPTIAECAETMKAHDILVSVVRESSTPPKTISVRVYPKGTSPRHRGDDERPVLAFHVDSGPTTIVRSSLGPPRSLTNAKDPPSTPHAVAQVTREVVERLLVDLVDMSIPKAR